MLFSVLLAGALNDSLSDGMLMIIPLFSGFGRVGGPDLEGVLMTFVGTL